MRFGQLGAAFSTSQYPSRRQAGRDVTTNFLRVPSRVVVENSFPLEQVRPSRSVREVCGMPGMPPCPERYDARTGLGGLGNLGLVNTAYCSSFDDAVATLGDALSRALSAGLGTNPTYLQAKQVYDDETSLLLWRRTAVGVWNCTAQTARIGGLINAVNGLLSTANVPQTVVPPAVQTSTASAAADTASAAAAAQNPPAPTDIAGTIKFVAVAAVAIAGAVVLAPIIGEAVGFSKVARSRLK